MILLVNKLSVTFLHEPELICLPKVKWFQAFLILFCKYVILDDNKLVKLLIVDKMFIF